MQKQAGYTKTPICYCNIMLLVTRQRSENENPNSQISEKYEMMACDCYKNVILSPPNLGNDHGAVTPHRAGRQNGLRPAETRQNTMDERGSTSPAGACDTLRAGATVAGESRRAIYGRDSATPRRQDRANIAALCIGRSAYFDVT